MKIYGVILLLLCLNFTGCREEKIILSSTSPQGEYTVNVILLPTFDYNFRIELVNSKNKTTEILFNSPDERAFISEEIIWSADSRYFLLLGNRFLVKEAPVINGDYYAYFLYDLETKMAYCTAVQVAGYPSITIDQMRKIKFTKDLVISDQLYNTQSQ